MKYTDIICALRKQAADSADKGNIILDYLGTGASNIAPALVAGQAGRNLSQTANFIGQITGLSRADKDVKQAPSAMSLVPGASTDRFVRRLSQASRPYGATKATLASEQLGSSVGSLFTKLLAMAMMKRPNPQMAEAAAGVPKLLGGLSAAVTPTRTRAQQAGYERGTAHNWINWLLPGAADYNTFKRIGRIRADEKQG